MVNFTRTSKGYQRKWVKDGYWYKEDNWGGEAEVEWLVSEFLKACGEQGYLSYELVNPYTCRSSDFVQGGEFVTFMRLLTKLGYTEKDLKPIYRGSPRERLDFIFEVLRAEYGFTDAYLVREFSRMFELDRLILNTDRHWHNFGILKLQNGGAILVTLFDHGCALGVNNPKVNRTKANLKALRELEMRSKARMVSTGFKKQCDLLPEYRFRVPVEFTTWLESLDSVWAIRFRLRLKFLYKV